MADRASSGRAIEYLSHSSREHISISDQFYKKWQPETWNPIHKNAYPVPKIKSIYKLGFDNVRGDYWDAQNKIGDAKCRHGAGKGNELRRFHGTRILCEFSGTPCNDADCSACMILQTGKFKLNKGSWASGTATYGKGLYFTAMSHTAKGYGIDKSCKCAPYESLRDYVEKKSKNAVFVALCLAGNAEAVEGKPYIKGDDSIMPDPDARVHHSRVVNKPTGNDELVIFAESQALPRYIIIFDGPADTCDPSQLISGDDRPSIPFVDLTSEECLCSSPGCGKRSWNGKPNEYCSRTCRSVRVGSRGSRSHELSVRSPMLCGEPNQLPTVRVDDDATCEKIGCVVGLCLPFVGFIAFCVSCRSSGPKKKKWARYACASGTVGLILMIVNVAK